MNGMKGKWNFYANDTDSQLLGSFGQFRTFNWSIFNVDMYIEQQHRQQKRKATPRKE